MRTIPSTPAAHKSACRVGAPSKRAAAVPGLFPLGRSRLNALHDGPATCPTDHRLCSSTSLPVRVQLTCRLHLHACQIQTSHTSKCSSPFLCRPQRALRLRLLPPHPREPRQVEGARRQGLVGPLLRGGGAPLFLSSSACSRLPAMQHASWVVLRLQPPADNC